MLQERMSLSQYRKELGLGPVIPATGMKMGSMDDHGVIHKDKSAPEGKQRPSKYGANKTWVNGICFDSKGEAEYYQDLLFRMLAGDIVGIGRQVEFILLDGDGTVIKYKADFVVWFPDERAEVHEFKGMELPAWLLKEKLFRARFPRIPLIVVK